MADRTSGHFLAPIFFVACAGLSAAAWNAARFKPATQISDYGSAYPATLGNDGDRRNDSSRCVRTGNSTGKPWWQVDLQGQFTVESIVLTVSDDQPPVLTDFLVHVYDKDPASDPNSYKTCLVHSGAVNESRFSCQVVSKGQYVRLYRDKFNDYLKFCELEVIVSDARNLTSHFTAKKDYKILSPLWSEKTVAKSLLRCAELCKEHSEPWACNAFHWNTTSANCELLIVDPRKMSQTTSVAIKGVNFYIENAN